MKKLLGIMVMFLGVLVLPLNVLAEVTVELPQRPTCTDKEDSMVECVIGVNIKGGSVTEALTVNFTEKGGADIQSIVSADSTKWVVNANETPDGWAAVAAVTSIEGNTGESSLLTVTYKKSGQADCTIQYCLQGANNCGDMTPTSDKDTPTPNKQTGLSLPFVALGTIALLAGGAYVVTKGKAKMYRI